jgi:hypothetical protein
MRISNYPTDVLTGSELILGTDRDTGTLKYKTINFSVDTLKSFIYGGTNNQVIFEGTDNNENQTTLSAIEPSADITINLPNIAGTLPVLAAPSTTPIAATPEELNLLDGSIANTVVNSKAVIYGSAGQITGTFIGNITGNVTGDVTGDVTGNTSGTAATVTTAAQPTITSVGTLTALTVDNIVIDGAVIGHTSDADLITLADGALTVAGTIASGAITSTAGIAGTSGTFTDHIVTADDKGLWFNSGYETGYQGNDSTNTLTLITGNVARLTITPTSATFAGTVSATGIIMGNAVADPTRVDLGSGQAITHNDNKGTLLFISPGIDAGQLSDEITFNNTAIDADANVIIQMKSNIVADVIVYNIADDSCKFKILNKSGSAITDGTNMDFVYTVINQN